MSVNSYLKFETPGITGGSTDANHKGEIEVLSWSQSFSQPTSATRSTAGGGTVERAHHSDFSFTKYFDNASDDLLKYCWNGKHIGKATFTCYRADGENKPVEYLKVLMETVVVSNVSLGGGAGDVPIENVSLNYGKVTYTYVPQKPEDGTAGSQEAVYHDLTKNEVG